MQDDSRPYLFLVFLPLFFAGYVLFKNGVEYGQNRTLVFGVITTVIGALLVCVWLVWCVEAWW